jgi:hypothetical protein
MDVNHGVDWINVESTGEEEGLLLDDLPPAGKVSIGGQRFKVDEDEKYVEWMDFTFFIKYVHSPCIDDESRKSKLIKQLHSRYRNETSRRQI